MPRVKRVHGELGHQICLLGPYGERGKQKKKEKLNTEKARWTELGGKGGLERKRKKKKMWEKESRKGAERGDRRKKTSKAGGGRGRQREGREEPGQPPPSAAKERGPERVHGVLGLGCGSHYQ